MSRAWSVLPHAARIHAHPRAGKKTVTLRDRIPQFADGILRGVASSLPFPEASCRLPSQLAREAQISPRIDQLRRGRVELLRGLMYGISHTYALHWTYAPRWDIPCMHAYALRRSSFLPISTSTRQRAITRAHPISILNLTYARAAASRRTARLQTASPPTPTHKKQARSHCKSQSKKIAHF